MNYKMIYLLSFLLFLYTLLGGRMEVQGQLHNIVPKTFKISDSELLSIISPKLFSIQGRNHQDERQSRLSLLGTKNLLQIKNAGAQLSSHLTQGQKVLRNIADTVLPFIGVLPSQDGMRRALMLNSENDAFDKRIISVVGEVGSLHISEKGETDPVVNQATSDQKLENVLLLAELNSALLFLGYPKLSRLPKISRNNAIGKNDNAKYAEELIKNLKDGQPLPNFILEQFRNEIDSKMLSTFLLPPVMVPEINVGLAQSAWPASHRTGYAQASSPLAGPDGRHRLSHNFLNRAIVINNPITLFYSEDGKYLWGSSWTTVFKVSRTRTSLRLVDYVTKPLEKVFSDKFHGAYGLLTKENVCIIPSGDKLEAYYDIPGSDGAKIMQHPISYDLSDDLKEEKEFPAKKDEVIRGLCMSHDGNFVWASSHGRVGILSRFTNVPNFFKTSKAWTMLGKTHEEYDLEMSNNIACDESGGIYVVTSKFMHKLTWKKGNLSIDWETPYGTGSTVTEAARLGAGSGSTPTIMGSGDHKYIVITDDSPVMNVLIIDAKDGSVIDRHPINFGNEKAKKTVSEQSVLVHGWRLVVVNNTPSEHFMQDFGLMLPKLIGNPASLLLKDKDLASEIGSTFQNAWPVIVGDAPKGVEQLEFNPLTKKLSVTWINRDISIPNGIPTMSIPNGLIYGIGKRGSFGTDAAPMKGMWTLEAIDWWTGESKFYYNIGVGPWTNSIYAATQVGPREIITGTAGGIVRILEA